MAKSLDFNKLKKSYLTITLADEKNTTLMIGTPTKAVMDDLILLQSSLETLSENENNLDATNELYNACARVMSRNKAGVKITTEYLAEIFDLEDIIVFFDAYMDFVGEIADSKN